MQQKVLRVQHHNGPVAGVAVLVVPAQLEIKALALLDLVAPENPYQSQDLVPAMQLVAAAVITHHHQVMLAPVADAVEVQLVVLDQKE